MSFLDKVKREFTYLKGVRATQKQIGTIDPGTKRTVPDDFEASVDKHKRNVAIRFEGKLFTYEELDSRANQYANWALDQGFRPGDAVALFMENKPDYIAFWVGLSKVGVVSALINNSLQGQGLAHCVNIAKAKALVIGPEQEDLLKTADGLIDEGTMIWTVGGEIEGTQSLDPVLVNMPESRPDASIRQDMTVDDLCLYIYTSGTTGLPKAARLTHARTLGMMNTFIAPCNITARDRIYLTLPLYHGTGGICGVGQALLTGASLILRRKFSASAFWDDAVEERATAFVYIGELCRYLMNTKEHPLERKHNIRTGFGNGLRPEVWGRFEERFGIKHLVEFYGSTEGNVSFLNFDGKVGAIGRLPKYMEDKITTRIVKFDIAEEKPIRDADGFCIEADVDEAGEAIGKIRPEARFDGYNDPEQTEKKILRDVFEPGDMWFRTGDLLKKDEHAYMYFIDRIGDTFRWKGENVSTNEVAEALAVFEDVKLPNVYGVNLPETDGRAGMASITLDGAEELNGKGLAAHVDKFLPAYARPIFIRVQPEAETTGTFKYRKVDLVKEGYDLTKIDEGDKLYVRLPGSDAYEPLTPDIQAQIEKGEVKF
jgi:fatty-acyl-CoA synthase